MGRTAPSHVLPPNHTRRAERAMRAKEVINKAIPEMLRSDPKARRAIHKSERIVEPAAVSGRSTLPPGRTHIKIRSCGLDTLSAASALDTRRLKGQPNVAILNFASPLRPGGGFLDGANSQEEFLCARTTLYPSLWDHFYRLPEVGGIHTQDVLVFRDSTPLAADLHKADRFHIDVISAGMLRFPDTEQGSCSCGVSYCDRDRDLVVEKMRAVMRMAESKGSKSLVLGAWGCGAYGNPVAEIAKLWRKVIAGGPRQKKSLAESWSGLDEIIFAIPDRNMLYEFDQVFEDILSTEPVVAHRAVPPMLQAVESELLAAIMKTEGEIECTSNAQVKARLRDVLARLHSDLEREEAARDADLTLEEDEVAEETASSDPEASNLYTFDENDVASDSSDGEHSEIYDFRRQKSADTGVQWADGPSPNFDCETGWFSGSMDELSRMLKLSSPAEKDLSSPGTPAEGYTFNERAVDLYLSRYGGTDAQSAPESVK